MSPYCILMAVYAKDRPEFFLAAVSSVLRQTLPPAQLVLVEDGPLGAALEEAVKQAGDLCAEAGCAFTPVPLEKNGGLGPALNRGLAFCAEELVGRMDADDLSLPGRFEKQVRFMDAHPDTVLLSGTVIEFEGETPAFDAVPDGLSRRALPLTDEEIRRAAPSRNPVNHPCVMFRRGAVTAAGGYRSVPLFEDYDLWLRMLFGPSSGGCRAANLPEELLLMRTDGMFSRRGGLSYAGNILRFRLRMLRDGYLGFFPFLTGTAARIFVSLLPGSARRWFYRTFLR